MILEFVSVCVNVIALLGPAKQKQKNTSQFFGSGKVSCNLSIYSRFVFLMVLQSFKNLETNSLDSCAGVFFFFADACFNDSPN